MVTAETAVVLPFVVMVAFVLVWAVSLGVTQVRMVDAAREAARMSVRGDDATAVRATAERMSPDDATVEVTSGAASTEVKIVVRSRLDLPGFDHLPPVRLVARAVSATEDAP